MDSSSAAFEWLYRSVKRDLTRWKIETYRLAMLDREIKNCAYVTGDNPPRHCPRTAEHRCGYCFAHCYCVSPVPPVEPDRRISPQQTYQFRGVHVSTESKLPRGLRVSNT